MNCHSAEFLSTAQYMSVLDDRSVVSSVLLLNTSAVLFTEHLTKFLQ